MNSIKQKPWNSPENTVPNDVFEPKGMLGDEERRFLYWVACVEYSGSGCIVDAGAYIGSSAYCLASGLSANALMKTSKSIVHSFDLFVAQDKYVADDISRVARPLKLGEGYLDLFKAQTARHADLIKIHPGDLLGKTWSGEAIEILFIDVAKTQELNSHIIREFFPALIPGKSIVIQQDFYHIWHPYIHVAMEYLCDYFEIIDPYVKNQSRIYRLIREIPAEEIDRIARYDFSLPERIRLLERSAIDSPSPTKQMLHAIIVYDAILAGDKSLYFKEDAAFRLRYPNFRTDGNLWAVQYREIEASAKDRFRS